ncbi:MAG: hypothetical protein FD167_2706 [bacterium]|nr:MAG: hypothetical protein FD167_2706 [bacterium]
MSRRSFLFSMFLLVITLFSLSPSYAQVAEPSSGVSFPAQVNVGGTNATITGVGLRKRAIFKVYAIASYMDSSKINKAADPYTQLLTDGPAKQITMHFVRDVDAASIRSAFEDSLKNNIPSYATSPAKKNADAFLAAQVDMKTNQEIVLHWTQGGKIDLVVNGQSKASFTDPVLARGIWSIWLGASPISGDIKTGLVTKMK